MQFINRGVDTLDEKIKAEVALIKATGVDIQAVDSRPDFDDTASGASPGGHGVCSKHPWINGLITKGTDLSPYSFHPNATGQGAFAAEIEATL
jgi:hypothetical protein